MSEGEDGANTLDPELLKKYFGLDDECEAEILSLQVANMNAQGEVRDKQKRQFKMAIAEGLPKDALKLELKRHRLDVKHARQQANLVAEEEDDVVELADQIREILGDFGELPLGKAAVESAGGDAPKPKARGRKKKTSGEQVDTSAGAKATALDSIDDSIPEPDDRPRFLREGEADRVAENTARLEAGIRPLN